MDMYLKYESKFVCLLESIFAWKLFKIVVILIKENLLLIITNYRVIK